MLDQEIRQVLQNVGFGSLVINTSRVLNRIGYSDVQMLGRRRTRQHSYHGGSDLDAREPLPLFQTKTIAKVIQDDIRIRMVDEMVGAMHRQLADFGVIVTPFAITASVRSDLPKLERRRIRIIQGDELAQLMVRERIGIVDRGGVDRVDYRYFETLEEVSSRLIEFEQQLKKEGIV